MSDSISLPSARNTSEPEPSGLSNQRKLDMFDTEQDWLSRQPGMANWQAGCRRIAESIDAILVEHTTTLCGSPPQDEDVLDEYRRRLWRCIAFFWRRCTESPTEDSVGLEGILDWMNHEPSIVRRDACEGNPLFDVVLAQAVGDHEPPALAYLEEHYRTWLLIETRTWFPNLFDEDERWQTLLLHFVGVQRGRGRLLQYRGEADLRSFMRTTAWRVARDRNDSERTYRRNLEAFAERRAEMHQREETPADYNEESECLRLLVETIREALLELDPDQRWILVQVFDRRLTGVEIAEQAGVNGGTITRRRQRAVEALAKVLERTQEAGGPRAEAICTCSRLYLEGTRAISLVQAVFEVFDQTECQEPES